MSWNFDDQILFLEYEYLQLEPIGLIFVLWFAVILLIQLLGMITHRIMTLGHIVSSTSIVKTVKDWFKNDKQNAVDGNQVLDEHGIDMIKRWQKSAMVSQAISCMALQFTEIGQKVGPRLCKFEKEL